MKSKEGIEEIGYIYTIMISSLFLSAILFSTSYITNNIITQNAVNEMREMTFKIASSVENLANIAHKNPNSSYILIVELSKTVKPYFYNITLENSTKLVKTESNLGITFQMNLHNVGNINISGSVGSDFSFVKLIYSNINNQKSIIIKGT